MPLDIPKNQDSIKDFVSSGKVDKALELLIDTAEQISEEKHNAALVLKVRWKNLQQDSSMGVLSASEENLEQARISKSLLELTDQLDDKEIGDILPTGNNLSKPLGILLLLVLVGAAAFAFLKFNTNTTIEEKTTVSGQLVFEDGQVASFMIMNFNDGIVVDTTDANGYYSTTLPFKPDQTVIVDILKDGKLYYDNRTLVKNLNKARFEISKQ